MILIYYERKILFFRTVGGFIQKSRTWLQSVSAISCKPRGGISHSSTWCVRDTSFAHSWANLLQDLLEKKKENSSKLRLNTSMCWRRGPTSGFWCRLFCHRLTSTWQSVSSWSRCALRSMAYWTPSRQTITSKVRALRQWSYHNARPPQTRPPSSLRTMPVAP